MCPNRADASSTVELQARVRQQAAVVQLGQHALADADLASLLDEAVALVADTLDVPYAAVLELSPDDVVLLLRAGVGWRDGLVGRATISTQRQSQAGYTLLVDTPVIVEDLDRDARFIPSPLFRDHGIISGITVIISGQNRPFGVLGAHTTSSRAFTTDDTTFLCAIANVLAAAIYRRQADDALRESEQKFRQLLQSAPVSVVISDSDGKIVLTNERAEQLFGYAHTDLVEQPIELLLPERFRVTHIHHRTQYVAAPHVRPMGVGLDLAGRRSDGTEFPIEVGLSSVETARGPLVMSFITDITERVLAYQTLERRVAERTQEIERRRQAAEGLREVLSILNSNRPLDEVLTYLVDEASRLLGADRVAIYRLEHGDGSFQVQAAHALDQGMTAPAELRLGHAAVGQALVQRQPVLLSARDDAGARRGGHGAVSGRNVETDNTDRASRYHTVLAVPIIVRDENYGGLALYYHDQQTFADEAIALAVTLSDQAALAIENARLRRQVEQAAVVAERSRLARDLHDSVTQTLFSASLIAAVLPRLWERNPVDGRRRLDELNQLARGALAEMRTLLLELRPAALMSVRLGDLLEQLGEAMTGRARVPVRVSVESDRPLPPDVQVALYRIVQEALNNVAKHANAQHAAIMLRARAARVEVEVWDDGQGFDLQDIGPEHLGLDIMRERAAAIDAILRIESQIGQGTRVMVSWVDLQPQERQEREGGV